MNKIYKNKKELIGDLINNQEVVLDVGFWGQGVNIDNPSWVHNLLKQKARDVYGLDLDFDESRLEKKDHYKKASAENFDFNIKFDVIFAGDLIEHLSNPGLFLEALGRNLKDNGRLILTTPNCFSLFNLAEKLTKDEPTVNKDHTCYFNKKTLTKLLEKNGWQTESVDYLYTLETEHQASWKKKFLNIFYWFFSKITPKFVETLVVI